MWRKLEKDDGSAQGNSGVHRENRPTLQETLNDGSCWDAAAGFHDAENRGVTGEYRGGQTKVQKSPKRSERPMKEGKKKRVPSGIGEEVGGLFLGGRRGEKMAREESCAQKSIPA